MYHAIYLEELTAAELTEKLAQLFRVPAQQIQQIYKQGPTGIHVLVSDEVTPTCPTGTAGKVGGIPWEVHLGERHHQGSPGHVLGGAPSVWRQILGEKRSGKSVFSKEKELQQFPFSANEINEYQWVKVTKKGKTVH